MQPNEAMHETLMMVITMSNIAQHRTIRGAGWTRPGRPWSALYVRRRDELRFLLSAAACVRRRTIVYQSCVWEDRHPPWGSGRFPGPWRGYSSVAVRGRAGGAQPATR